MLKKSSVSPPILGGDDEKSNLLVADQKFVTPITRVVSRTSNIYNFSSSSLSKFSILDISLMKNKRNTFGNKIWILESQINSKSRLLIRVIIKHNRTNKNTNTKSDLWDFVKFVAFDQSDEKTWSDQKNTMTNTKTFRDISDIGTWTIRPQGKHCLWTTGDLLKNGLMYLSYSVKSLSCKVTFGAFCWKEVT